MSSGAEEPNSTVIKRQRLTNLGWWGAALLVGAPSISITLATSSVADFVELATSRYTYRDPHEAFYHPSVYFILFALGLAGAIMVLIGRETFEHRSSKPPAPIKLAAPTASKDKERA